ncbi:hypothetical protein K445DRAFT_370439 [Daldinia sp. EC12]|nr:hypothetical protein K445DRAFT_370439 [Daldinia sp. EC12]
MPHATDKAREEKVPKKLVLCFDGTGNTFSGSTADTNVVKIYDKLDKDSEEQYHYYQTGIGTYDIGSGSTNKGFLDGLQSKISSTLDQGFATTFDAHVIAGYRFIMRYYEKGDKIYMFGFSRGAFTARFLARMINTVGLLSKGNEEMVPFAYQLYQEYEQGKIKIDSKVHDSSSSDPLVSSIANKSLFWHNSSNATGPDIVNGDAEAEPLLNNAASGVCSDGHIISHGSHVADEAQMSRNKLIAFTNTFCRHEEVASHTDQKDKVYTGVKVYFLGLFDCVSSVRVLESPFGRMPPPVSVLGTANHVRHAVAIDERRVKFKAALLAQDIHHPDYNKDEEDIKEVWFPGNHGDVGGGWPAPKPTDTNKPRSWWDTIKEALTGSKPQGASQNNRADPYQMSDVALHWMINEVKDVEKREPKNALKWSKRLQGFEHNFHHFKENQAFEAAAHDTMRILGGSSLMDVLFWNFLEWLPFLARWEIGQDKFYYERIWPNRGRTRDIPADAVFHDSVRWRLEKVPSYRPQNNLGDGTPACLTDDKALVPKKLKADETVSEHHHTFVLKHDRRA